VDGTVLDLRPRPSSAMRVKVARMRQLAFIVPRRFPETFDTPPARRRCATGNSKSTITRRK